MKKFSEFLNIFGLLVLICLILLYLPVPLLGYLGYDSYAIASGSMEPAIPVGSFVVAQHGLPEEVSKGDIICFVRKGVTVTHRVVANNTEAQELITKGDANAAADSEPVGYSHYKSTVIFSLPKAGAIISSATSFEGKIAAISFLTAGFIMRMLSSLIYIREKDEKRGTPVITTLILLALAVFVFASFQRLKISQDNQLGEEEYTEIKELAEAPPSSEAGETAINLGDTTQADNSDFIDDGFTIDFVPLIGINSDTVAWLYFPGEGVNISYPVVHSHDNREYLTQTFSGNERSLGSIFLDYRCSEDLNGKVSIIYGHRMADNTMFGNLEKYENREFWGDNPEFFILTPDGQKHRCSIFAYGFVDDNGPIYQEESLKGSKFEGILKYIDDAALYDTGLEITADSRIIILSTCTKTSNNDREILCAVMNN